MPAAVERPRACEIAVAEQHRTVLAIGDDGYGVRRQHVGTVQEIGDPAKTLRLALGAEHPCRNVETLERCIGCRIDRRVHGEVPGGRWRMDRQRDD